MSITDSYQFFKLIHIITVIVTISLFLFRAALLIKQSRLAKIRWLKILPHINDTLLLFSAIAMLKIAGIMPDTAHSWLIFKIIAMVMYIVSGIYLFRYARSRQAQLFTISMAFILLIFIVYTAINKAIPF